MKKFTKILAMMLVVIMVVGMFSTVAYAAGATDSFESISKSTATGTNDIDAAVTKVGGSLISVIKLVARIIAVVMVMVFAVKWMMATPQKKQELKERLIYLAIGVILLFAGPAILDAIGAFGQQVL